MIVLNAHSKMNKVAGLGNLPVLPIVFCPRCIHRSAVATQGALDAERRYEIARAFLRRVGGLGWEGSLLCEEAGFHIGTIVKTLEIHLYRYTLCED